MRPASVGLMLGPAVDTGALLEWLTDFCAGLGYVPWSEPIPRGYLLAPWERATFELAARPPWGVLGVHSQRAPEWWAIRLSAALGDAALALHLPPIIDRVPGVGMVPRGGQDGAEGLKVYARGTPWLKVGQTPDEEIDWPLPTLVPERMRPVMEALRGALGDLAAPLESYLSEALRGGGAEVGGALSSLGLGRRGGAAGAALTVLHKDSMLYLNASPS